MDELKLTKWLMTCTAAVGTHDFKSLHRDLRTPALVPVVNAFLRNTGSALRLPTFLAELFLRGMVHEQQAINVPQSVIDAMEVVFDQMPFYHHHNFELIMSNQLVLIWTNFETLATDLWIAALNAQPEVLAALRGNEKRISRMAGGTPAVEPDQKFSKDKTVHLNKVRALTANQYDLSHRMGSLLRHRYQFSKLAGIRSAYSEAFFDAKRNTSTAEIDKALSNSGLDALSIVRNLLVHKAGVVDEEYQDKARQFSKLPQLDPDKNETLRINGDLCELLITPAIESCTKLVKAVNSWLALTK